MPTTDIRSDLEVQLAFNADIVSNTTTNGFIIDTAHFDGGIMFAFAAVTWVDGTYTPVLEESDDSGMAGANDISDDNLIGTEAGAVLTALTALGDIEPTIGIFGTKRYVRVKIVSTGVITGARIVVKASKHGEILPVV